MLVVSAGIGEVVRAAFEVITEVDDPELKNLQPFSIVSNLGVFEDSKLVRFNLPLIHIMNKAEHVRKFIEAQKELDIEHHHNLRGNIIVMGDVIEDLRMISEITYDNIIKIGYLNNLDIDKHLEEEYEKVFDIVIQHDGNLFSVINLLEVIAGEPISNKDKLPKDF